MRQSTQRRPRLVPGRQSPVRPARRGFLLRSLAWIRQNPGKFALLAWGAIWRLIAAVSFTYLMFDRIDETYATVASPASDPQHPFLFPFTITNHSLVFDLRNVSWNCHALSLKAGDITVINSGFLTGSAPLLAAGQSLNIYCDVAAASSHFVSESHGRPISEAVLEVQLRYNVDVFGLPWPRRPRPTKFTWFARATTPQWISGEFAQ